jgi:hypothetical protein
MIEFLGGDGGGPAMLKFVRGLGIVVLALVIFAGSAEARGWHGGGWRGGGWGYGWGAPYLGPYPYYGPGYYGPGGCSWVRVRVLRNHHWVVQRVWRCW